MICSPAGRHKIKFTSRWVMETPAIRRIVSAERLQGSVLIMFDDGKYAVYSAPLLYAHLDQAEQVDLDPEDVAEMLLEAKRTFKNAL